MKTMFRAKPAGGEMLDERTWSISSRGSTASMSSSSSSGMSNDHHLHLQAAAALNDAAAGSSNKEEEEEVVGVAVGKEVKECKANLLWVLSNMEAILSNGERKKKKKATVLLLHVHRPAKTIPFMGANFPADQLHESEVSAFRQAETESVNRAICARVKVAANAGDDVAQGVLSLVAQNGIARLVVGAAADKRYSRKLTAPTSKTALSVQQQAPTNCSIWFVCKGNLVSTRIAQAATSRKSDEEREATTTGHNLVQLGTFIQSLHDCQNQPSALLSINRVVGSFADHL